MEFYGRQDILAFLDKRADALSKGYRQNIAIIGDELIGKTFFLHYWLSRYCNNYIVPVYLEAVPEEIHSFAERFIASLLFSFLKNSQIALREDIGYLLEKSAHYIPHTCSLIEKLFCQNEKKLKKPAETFTKLLDLPEALYNESGKRCVIIFDEFQRLEDLPVKDIYPGWRKQIMLSKNTMFILVSSKKQAANKILSSDLDLLFGNFEKIELAAFDNKTALEFVHAKLKAVGAINEISDFIVYFGCGKPFYLKALCEAFTDYRARYSEVYPAINSLVASLEGIFVDSAGILHRRFSSIVSEIENRSSDPGAINVISALALGHNTTPKISHYTTRPKKYIATVLGELWAGDYITKSADVYTLDDKIFAFWLKHIYLNRLKAFASDLNRQKQIFREELTAIFRDFSNAQGKALSQRILELFNQFNDEAIEVHKKRLRLNHFKEVKLLNINGKRIKDGIVARAKNSIWITGLKEGKIGEEDVREFVNICKKFKYNKFQKKIFITLNELDANASLIAKEEKISTWDVSFLNSLLDIYGRPRIIR